MASLQGSDCDRVRLVICNTYSVFKRCEKIVLAKYRITPEQYTVLLAVEILDDPVRPTDVARWSERSANSVSMLADRMVKAGLLKRVRDKKDRRVVRLIITDKAEDVMVSAVQSIQELIAHLLIQFTNESVSTLEELLGALYSEASDFLEKLQALELP